jgi:murein DD-endopeptidase MepM/ murein hydrolase activator NlpD
MPRLHAGAISAISVIGAIGAIGAIVTAVLLASAMAAGAGRVPAAVVAQPATTAVVANYAPPIAGLLRILRPFAPPPTPYSAGHRGVDLSTAPGTVVRAAAAGTVLFAGSIAGRGVIVIAHPEGIDTEYEPVATLLDRGQSVADGEVIGRVSGAHGDCPLDGCLHWGARRSGVYIDPMTLLRRLGVVHLVPLAT